MSSRRITIMLVLAALASASTFGGPDWTEIPDAGKFNPQLIPLTKQPRTITGDLIGLDADGGPDIADTYALKIDQDETLVVSTNVPLALRGQTNFNATLYLFTQARVGLVANDDVSTGSNNARLWAYSTDGTGVRLNGPGTYILAVSFSDVTPANALGPIFAYGAGTLGGRFQISGPDGAGGSQPFSTWQGNITAHPAGTYEIRIEPRTPPDPCIGDANGDLRVDFADVTAVLGNWQFFCPMP